MSITNSLVLKRQFGLLSFLSILLITLLSGYSISSFLTHKILLREATLTAEFVDGIVAVDEIWRGFERMQGGRMAEELANFARHLATMPDVLNANIYSTDHKVLWASNLALVGKHFQNNHELDEALAGTPSYETGIAGVNDGKPEHRAMSNVDGGMRFVEIYVPIRDDMHEHVLGVVELYKQPKVLNQSIVEAVQLVWAIALLSAAVLYLALNWMVRRAANTIDTQSQRLIESESLSMIGETASAIAHAMRNPLASIRASAELTLNDDIDGARESARDIISEADRLSRWARELLQLSRASADTAMPVNVSDVLADVIDEHRPMFTQSAIDLQCDIPPEPLWVRADAMPLAQVFGNLLVNAAEAMAGGGQLKLVAQTSPIRGRACCLQVVVHDAGGGLPEAMRDRVFKPFATTKPHGTGLGLALSQRLLGHYGGRLDIEDRPGEGVTATVSLPMRPAS